VLAGSGEPAFFREQMEAAMEREKEPTIGDNSGLTPDEKFKLSGYVEELVRLETNKREIGVDIREILASAKDAKFSAKAIKAIVKRRMMDDEKVKGQQAFEELLDVYMHALGDYATTPLGRAMAPSA
jgi:uncharacterized protein (UPF0335 family)